MEDISSFVIPCLVFANRQSYSAIYHSLFKLKVLIFNFLIHIDLIVSFMRVIENHIGKEVHYSCKTSIASGLTVVLKIIFDCGKFSNL